MRKVEIISMATVPDDSCNKCMQWFGYGKSLTCPHRTKWVDTIMGHEPTQECLDATFKEPTP